MLHSFGHFFLFPFPTCRQLVTKVVLCQNNYAILKRKVKML
jgi:hypothetical protein